MTTTVTCTSTTTPATTTASATYTWCEDIKKDPIARRRVITRCDEFQRENIERVLDVIVLPDDKNDGNQSDTPARSTSSRASSPRSPPPPKTWGMDFNSKTKQAQQQKHSDSEDSYDTRKAKQSEGPERKKSEESHVTDIVKRSPEEPKEKKHEGEQEQVVPAPTDLVSVRFPGQCEPYMLI
jgi:hypothetical protein